MTIHRSRSRAFTLIELIAVLVILAVLSAIALPRLFDYSDESKAAADSYIFSAISEGLVSIYRTHRIEDAPSSEYITTLDDLGRALEMDELPTGWHISGNRLYNHQGHEYTLIAETDTSPARLELTSSGGGGGGGGGGASS
ncbi:MAG: type II secretion system protein [Phycisphaerales bacterium JB043]